MENPLWKKLQNDPALLKQFTQHQHIGNGLEGSNNEETPNSKRTYCDELEGDNNFKNNGRNSEQYNNEYQNNYNKTGTSSFPKKHPNPIQNQSVNQQQNSIYALDHQNQQLQQLINLKNFQESQSSVSNELESQKQSLYYENNGDNQVNSSQFYGQDLAMNPVKNRFPTAKRELGLVEKLVGSYGFVKCLDREGRLFFHYSSFQAEEQASNGEIALKISDLVEFEEGIDRRNGKPVAINITRFQQNSQQPDKIAQQSADQFNNVFNLNKASIPFKKQHSTTDKPGQINGDYDSNTNTGQQDYQTIMNGLKMLNIQSLKDKEQLPSVVGENRLNPTVMNLFNKENIFKNDLHQFNLNNNLLNMIKSAANSQTGVNDNGGPNNSTNNNNNISMNDNLSNLAKILNSNELNPIGNIDVNKCPGNEQIEGTIAIVATKKTNTSHYNNRGNFYSPQLDGRITYQRSGETFYIPYSFYDVLPNSPTMPSYSQIQLKTGDRVRFYIAQSMGNELNVPNGTYYAQRIELAMHSKNNFNFNVTNNKQEAQMLKPVYRGIITTLKESFGKIEREDQFKETFFHFHEYIGKNPNQELKLGLNVEFELQDRYGKEIACNVKMLPSGTVSFDELSRDVFIGRIIQPLTKVSNLLHNTNLNGINLNDITSIGKLVFDNNNSNENETLSELLFSDLDRLKNASGYSLLEGDFVQFRISSDKRQRSFNNNTQMHRQKRATQLTLIEEHSLIDNIINTGEYRERGILVKFSTAKDLLQNNDIHNSSVYGAIKCLEQNDLVYFSASEIINYVKFSTNAGVVTPSVREVDLQIGDSLEFSIVKCQKDLLFKNGLQAIRVQKLPENTVKFETISPETYTGCIESETYTSYKNNNTDKHLGSIKFEGNKIGQDKSICFDTINNNNEATIKKGDRVQFNISTCLKTKKQLAVNLKQIESESEQGFITMLRDDYGLIESIPKSSSKKASNDKQQIGSKPRLIYFHFNSVKDLIDELEVGDEVEFKVKTSKSDQKLCVESLNKLKNGTIKLANMSQIVLKGRITQQLNPGLDEGYYGKVLVSSSKKENETCFEFGVYGVGNKKKGLQVGDIVTFQLGSFQDGIKRAVNLHVQEPRIAQRNGNSGEFKKGKIDSIKGHCGFIEYATGNSLNELKKVFFHISDLISEGGSGKSESSSIQVGDEVEFISMHNSRTGKYSAIKIKKTSTTTIPQQQQLHHVSSSGKDLNEQDLPIAKRPEHLITKLKIGNVCDINGKKLCLTRQPTKPDGKSFMRVLYERVPGLLETDRLEFIVTEKVSPDEAASNLNVGLSESKMVPLTVMD
jgi:cold shock CspA family protein